MEPASLAAPASCGCVPFGLRERISGEGFRAKTLLPVRRSVVGGVTDVFRRVQSCVGEAGWSIRNAGKFEGALVSGFVRLAGMVGMGPRLQSGRAVGASICGGT